METADFLNIFYKLNGGSQVSISSNTDSFAEKTVAANNLSGSTLEIIVTGQTSFSDETYTVSNINVTDGGGGSSSSSSSSSSSGATSVPGRLQAEDYVGFSDTTSGNSGNQYRNDDVDIEVTTDAGGGFNVGWIAANEWLEYPVSVSQAGEYRADTRVASSPGNGMFTVEVDGQTPGNAITVEATGSWQTWVNKSTSLGQLSAGNKTLRVQVQAGEFNLNWLDIVRTGTGSSSSSSSSSNGSTSSSGGGGDQCDSTAQCLATWPNATDCLNSQSNNSVCMCGSQRCDSGGSSSSSSSSSSNGGTGTLGRFDKGKDLWLAHFDHKHDPDDNHANAGVATLLADSRFSGIDFRAVLGTIGRQGGSTSFSRSLYNNAFGNRWSDAFANRNQALNEVTAKMVTALDRGGDVWIAEGGQSDFSADLVRRIKNQRPGVNTNNRIHIIQHSNWNEQQTTPSDLTYVRNNTDYRKIPDGNHGGNGSADLHDGSSNQWGRATSDPQVGAIWSQARSVANFPGTKIDFSDTVESLYIFGFEGLSNVSAFFNQFL